MSNFLSCCQFFPITNWIVDYRLVVHICLSSVCSLSICWWVLINLVVLFSPLCFRGRTHGHPCKTHHQADGMGHYGCSYEERVALFVALSHNIASCVSFVYISFDHLEWLVLPMCVSISLPNPTHSGWYLLEWSSFHWINEAGARNAFPGLDLNQIAHAHYRSYDLRPGEHCARARLLCE